MTPLVHSAKSTDRRLLARVTVSARLLAAAGLVILVVVSAAWAGMSPRWSADERATLRSLSLAQLEPLPADPSNRVADDDAAAAFGRQLFFETRLSSNGEVSCGTCHAPAADFQDDLPLAKGIGTTARRTMPVAATAYSPWLFWDGRADSQWAQALGPLESAVEHGGNRTLYAHVVAEHYRTRYEAIFGRLPDLSGLPRNAGPVADSTWRTAWQRLPAVRQEQVSRIYANLGKAIAAYERRITFAPSRFDRYVDAELADRPHTPESALTSEEEAGLRLFIGKANCVNCHNGPRFTDDHFHNTGVPASAAISLADSGRATGVPQALTAEFNCTSRYSDATADDCSELRFATTDGPELVRAFKTPTLRNVATRAPYMHAGQVTTLDAAVAQYSDAPRAPFGHSELKPLRLTRGEQARLVAFLRTLSGPLAAPPGFLEPPTSRR